MTPAQRRRIPIALGACLLGLVIALHLMTRPEHATGADTALASAGSPSSSSSSSSVSPSSASASAPATPSDEKPTSDDENAGIDHDEAKDDDESARTDEPADRAASARERSAPLTQDDGTPRDRPRPLGSLDAAAIQDAMQRMKPLLQTCYESALKHDPSLAGKLTLQFQIEAEDDRGVVTKGTIADSETASPFFEACVLEKVRAIEVPPPSGGGSVEVTYAFEFDPGGGFGGDAPPGDGTVGAGARGDTP